MPVKTLKQGSTRGSQKAKYDAIIKEIVVAGSHFSKESIRVERRDGFSMPIDKGDFTFVPEADHVIYVEIPEYSDLDNPKEEIKRFYLDAFRFASENGYKSVVTEIFYKYVNQDFFGDILNSAYRAAYAAEKVEKYHLNITIAINKDAQEKLKLSLPQEILVRKPSRDVIFNRVNKAPTSAYMMEALYRRVDDCGYTVEIEVPDELEIALQNADYQDYQRSEETATQVLFSCLGEHDMSKSAIQMELIEYLGKTTVYNALNPQYTKKALDKKTIVYVALAMGMDLLETKRALNAARHKFIPKDPIDMVYAYSINHHLSVDQMRDILLAKDLLEYEN